MKLKRLGSIFLAAAMMTAALTGCGGGDSKAEGGDSKAEGGKSTVTLWATGSDNVRSIFEKLTEDFNTNSEYKDQYQVELQFMLSGTGAQGLADMVAAAGKAGQTNTDYDIVDWSGDDLAKIMSKIGEESFVKLDKSKIPNAASVEAKSAVAQDYAQPYRGTTVILAYDSEKVPTPPKTMDELVEWMKANPGRFAYNAPGTGGAGDSFARTSVYNFLPEEAITSGDEKWVGEWDKGFEFLKSIHPYMYKSGGSIVYPNKNQGTLDPAQPGRDRYVPELGRHGTEPACTGRHQGHHQDHPDRPVSDRLFADSDHPDLRLQRGRRLRIHELHALRAGTADHGQRHGRYPADRHQQNGYDRL